ncbi:cell wall hydrolase [Acinetobacter sp.]|uniref:cell wall hydrolase n=1 Tax=Acinetobacter sp. TaxID=472 RepID=UPI003890F9CE
MADGAVIRDFLVALGFKTDNAGLSKMQDAMKGLEWKAKALNGAFLALATGAVMAIRQTAGELDKLYFSSQRIGASVSNINAYGNAISQLGGSAESAVGSLESLAEKMRNSPGYESQIKSLGVDTRQANGQMRDRVEVMKDLSGVLAKMPAYQANAYASSLGIDQNTLLAMRDGKFMANMEKYQRIQQQLGMNDDLAKSGNEFMTEYRDLTMITKTGFQVIVMQAGKALLPILKLLNQAIQAGIAAFSQLNPHIKEGLAVGLRFALLAVLFGAFFKTFAVIAKILPMMKALIGLIKILRLAILASPIGIILALAAALALLYDDYAKWKDGGKSLIDWSKWTNGIDKIIAKIKDFLAILDSVKDKVINFVQKIVSDPIEAVKEVAEVAKEQVEKVGEKTKEVAKDVVNSAPIKKAQEVAKQAAKATATVAKKAKEAVSNAKPGKQLNLSEQDIVDIMKVASTEVVGSLKGKSFEQQAAGVVDTILNRTASGKYGKSVRDVVNQRWAFSDINAPRKSAYGSVQNVPMKRVSKRMENFVRQYLDERAHGKDSSVGLNVSYANPNYLGEASKATKKWVREVEQQAKRTGQIYGAGKAIHVHGTPSADAHKKPKPFVITTPKVRSNVPNTSTGHTNLNLTSSSLSNTNPHKSQVNSTQSLRTQSVVVHQTYKTDMVINGADRPMEVANAVQRQQENAAALMARRAQGPLA